MSKDVLILIPAYNEGKNIGNVLNQIKSSTLTEYADLLVVNDGSQDNTDEVVKGYGFSVLSQVYNIGYGAALQTGYKYAVQEGYKFVIQIDGDGQHDIKNIDNIYKKLTTPDENSHDLPDIVIGSRFLKGSETFKVSKLRLFVMGIFRRIIKIATKKNITDPTSGLQGLNRRAFYYYATYLNFDIKYPDINMIIQMLLRGFSVVEIPAIMHARQYGVAMHSGIWSPFKYLLLMTLSTLSALLRNSNRRRKNGIK